MAKREGTVDIDNFREALDQLLAVGLTLRLAEHNPSTNASWRNLLQHGHWPEMQADERAWLSIGEQPLVSAAFQDLARSYEAAMSQLEHSVRLPELPGLKLQIEATTGHLSEYFDHLNVLIGRLVAAARDGVDISPELLDIALEKGLPTVVRDSLWRARVGAVYRTGQLQDLLSAEGRISDEAVRSRMRNRKLIGFKTSDGRWAWPDWQFESDRGRLQPRQTVIALWNELDPPEGRELTAISWMRGRRRDLEDETPLDYLDGHGVDAALHRAASRWHYRNAA